MFSIFFGILINCLLLKSIKQGYVLRSHFFKSTIPIIVKFECMITMKVMVFERYDLCILPIASCDHPCFARSNRDAVLSSPVNCRMRIHLGGDWTNPSIKAAMTGLTCTVTTFSPECVWFL